MGTMVTSTDRVVKTKIGIGDGGQRPTGPNGGSRGNGHGKGGGDSPERFSPSKYRIGVWVALASVAMMFTALTSAYIVRANSSNDWQPLVTPPLLWLSTGLIVASSVTFEIARRALKRGPSAVYNRWLMATMMLGLGFLVSQLLAWRQLVAQGIYLSSNPHSSFFYVLTGAHGLHLLGGILALDYLLVRSWRRRYEDHAAAKRQAAADAVALYWHFMDGLWIYLFLLLFLWR
jgi:cytochrome c oxidase subunit 3